VQRIRARDEPIFAPRSRRAVLDLPCTQIVDALAGKGAEQAAGEDRARLSTPPGPATSRCDVAAGNLARQARAGNRGGMHVAF
jgi:hypothetical protein